MDSDCVGAISLWRRSTPPCFEGIMMNREYKPLSDYLMDLNARRQFVEKNARRVLFTIHVKQGPFHIDRVVDDLFDLWDCVQSRINRELNELREEADQHHREMEDEDDFEDFVQDDEDDDV